MIKRANVLVYATSSPANLILLGTIRAIVPCVGRVSARVARSLAWPPIGLGRGHGVRDLVEALT